MPNGARINIGALGNTAFAELSADVTPAGHDAGPASAPADSGGCGCRVGATGEDAGFGLPLLLAALTALCRLRRSRRH